MDLAKFDVLIFNYDGYEYLSKLFDSIRYQHRVEIKNIIVPIKLTNTEDDEKIRTICKENNATTFEVEAWYFSSVLTKQRAIKQYCKSKIVVCIGDSVLPMNNQSLYNLTKDIHNGKCVYTFGRQVCRRNSVEKYVKQKFYPTEAFFFNKEVNGISSASLFSDDNFSAIDRDVFLKLGGYQEKEVNVPTGLLYSYMILKAGYQKKYCGDAVSLNDAKYGLKKINRTYFKVGKFYGLYPELRDLNYYDKYVKLTRYVLGRAFRDFNLKVIFTVVPNIICRKKAFRKGLKNQD